MAYIGNIPAEAYTNTVKDSFNGTGSATAFTLSQPTVTNDVRVVVENVVQDPTVAYSVSGTTLTFTSAPPSGTANIYVVHLGAAVMTAIPPSEIADATVFASNVTVQGAFTSQGIDDNATSTAMTLDASGNLLVGKTSAGYNVDGFEARQNGETYVSRSGTPMAINRNSSDGTLLNFYKSGTTVGSIQTKDSRLFISGSQGSNPAGIYFGGGGDVLPASTTNAVDNSISLGGTGNRWKDLYLSGGVYLGGTGAANYLSDYEEGTWLPSIEFASAGSTATVANSTYTTGSYTKVGDIVTVEFNISGIVLGNGTSNLQMSLPFTHVGIAAYPGKNQASSGYTVAADTASGYSGVLKVYGVGPLNLMYDSGTNWAFINNGNASTISPNSINGQFTYHTNQ